MFNVFNLLIYVCFFLRINTASFLRYANRLEYVSLVASIRLSESTQQCEAIRRGLSTVFPFMGILSLFTWQQLETLITGTRDIDIELLRVRSIFSFVYLCLFDYFD
jgi:hypothetical protein